MHSLGGIGDVLPVEGTVISAKLKQYCGVSEGFAAFERFFNLLKTCVDGCAHVTAADDFNAALRHTLFKCSLTELVFASYTIVKIHDSFENRVTENYHPVHVHAASCFTLFASGVYFICFKASDIRKNKKFTNYRPVALVFSPLLWYYYTSRVLLKQLTGRGKH